MIIIDDHETPLTPEQVAEVLRWATSLQQTPDGEWVVRFSVPVAEGHEFRGIQGVPAKEAE